MIVLLLTLMAIAQDPNTPSAENQTTTEEEVELLPLVKNPELEEYVQAPYPEKAKEEGREGTVLLLIEIDEVGDVSYIEVLQSAGDDFDAAAVEAAWNFVFSPAEDKDGPVPVQIEFEYGFVLDASKVEGAIEDEEAKIEIEKPVNLDGTLKEMGTKRVLADFPITITTIDGQTIETSTDSNGNYEFQAYPAGTITISVSYPEYQPLTKQVEVFEDQRTTVQLWVKNLNYREDELVGMYRKPSADVSRRTLTVEEIRRVPGTFGDPVRVIQNLPGAARSPFGSGLLVIRGANPEDSAVYVDGIRIPLIYHLGGYVSVLNADLIETVDYMPGSYGVQYGRSLGGVVEVKTKKEFPEQGKFTWSTDVLDSGGFVQGRVNNFGIAAAGRRSYVDAFIPLFTKNSNFVVKPRWYDYQVKIDHLERNNGQFSVFLFGFQDTLEASTADDFAQGTDPDSQGDFGTQYSTHRAYIKWTHNVNDNWQLRLLPSFGIDSTVFNAGGGVRVEQDQPSFVVRAESEWKLSESASILTGLDLITGGYSFEAQLPFSLSNATDFDPLAERDPISFGGDGNFIAPDLYLQGTFRPLKDKDRWVIYPGIRMSALNLKEQGNDDPLIQAIGFDPRVSSRFKITKNSTIKGGIGIYSQGPQPFEVWRPEGSTQLKMEKVSSAEVGLEQQITPSLQGDLSIFGKNLYDLIVSNPDLEVADDLFYINEGIGRVYGMEVIIKQAPVNNFFGWVSYTLSKSERNNYPNRDSEISEDEVENSPSSGGWYLFDLDQTHILVAVAGYQLPRDFGISGKFQYVTGNPYTPYSGGIQDLDQNYYIGYSTAEYNSERLPAFISVDLRLDKTITFQKWQLETYVDLINTIRGENPEFLLYNYDYTESRYIRGLPFIPSLGFEANFSF
jgi:TonB family protein